MADLLFDRRVRVIIAVPLESNYSTMSGLTVEITDLRVQFKVEKTLEKHPNTAEINITNLAEKTRAQLRSKGAKVVLQAGYATTLATVFVGDARTIDHTRDGTDWLTKIQAGDGERGIQYARISESFAPGIKMPGIVTTFTNALGFDPGDSLAKLAPSASKQFVNGYSAHGKASAELDKILRANGYEWSVQDGRLQILRPGEVNTERLVKLSSESGLVGSPEFSTPENAKKKPVLKFKSLLSPEIRPGGRLAFASVNHQGIHRVTRIVHTGDTAGGDWYTTGECEVAIV